MTKILPALIFLTTASAFHIPRNLPVLQSNSVSFSQVSNAVIATIATTATAPLVAIAAEQEDDYVYGAVAAPGGIGLAAALGVLAILTAAVPAVLSPGEDAFNEMKERDQGKWGKK